MYMAKTPPLLYQHASYILYKTCSDLLRHPRLALLCLALCFISVLISLKLCSTSNEYDARLQSGQYSFALPTSEKSFEMSTFLLVAVISAPAASKRRDVIRKTWWTFQVEDTVKLFVIGTRNLPLLLKSSLEEEQSRNRDLLLLDNVTDSYSNLTGKMLETYQWLHRHVDFKYVFKGDDDTFARLDYIFQALKQTKHTGRLYWGYFQRGRIKKAGPWAEKDFVLCERYLPYALGGGYILSADLVSFIAVNSQFFKVLGSEDVSVGFWLSSVEMTRVHDIRFDTQYVSRGCSDGYWVTHKQTEKMIEEKFVNIRRFNKLCEKEFAVKHSYIYNWTAEPDKCCVEKLVGVPRNIKIEI